MWQVVLLILSIASATLWYKTRSSNKYRLDVLALISGAATTMFFVDSIYSYVKSGEFLEVSLDSVLLGIVLVFSAIILWVIYVTVTALRK